MEGGQRDWHSSQFRCLKCVMLILICVSKERASKKSYFTDRKSANILSLAVASRTCQQVITGTGMRRKFPTFYVNLKFFACKNTQIHCIARHLITALSPMREQISRKKLSIWRFVFALNSRAERSSPARAVSPSLEHTRPSSWHAADPAMGFLHWSTEERLRALG